jgi:hypothetical protein
MDQLYTVEIHRILELVGVLNERVVALDATIHYFGEALQQVQQQVPGSFQIIYNPEVDENGVMLASL